MRKRRSSPELEPRAEVVAVEPPSKALETVARTALLGALILTVILLFWSTKTAGLDDMRAMAIACLARNIAAGRGYVNDTFTPLSLHFVPSKDAHPELTIMPIYPLLLALVFRFWQASDVAAATLSVFFLLVALLATYFLVRRWFGYLVAVTTLLVTGMHFLPLQAGTSGLPITFLMCLALVLFHILSWEMRHRDQDTLPAWATPERLAMLTAVLLGIAVLTRFEMLAWVPVLWVYWLLRARRKWRLSAIFWGTFLLVLAPWILRCSLIARRPILTLQGYEIIMATGNWPGQSVYRSFTDVPPVPTIQALLNPRTMLGKLHRAVRFTYRTLPGVANPYIVALFVAGFLLPGRLWEEFRLRWWILALLGAQVVFMCVYVPWGEMISLFVPVMVALAAATVLKALYETRVAEWPVSWGRTLAEGFALGSIVLIVTYPLADVLFVQPVATENPMRKIAPKVAAKAGLVMSDVPQAIAWYGNCKSMLFVHHPNDLYNLRKAGIGPDVIYLSPQLLGYPVEELVGFWQSMVIEPRDFAGYEVDRSFEQPGRRWTWAGEKPGSTAVPPTGRPHPLLEPRPEREPELETPQGGGAPARLPAGRASPP